MKNLIRCPDCESRGIKQYLGEVNNGTLSVLRFKDAKTIIVGDKFDVYCGICGNKVYMKGGQNEENLGSIWKSWISGSVHVQISGTIG